MFSTIGNSTSLCLQNTVAVFPILSQKNMIVHVFPLGDGKRTKFKWKLNESTRKKVINTEFGLFYSKIYHNIENTPLYPK